MIQSMGRSESFCLSVCLSGPFLPLLSWTAGSLLRESVQRPSHIELSLILGLTDMLRHASSFWLSTRA